MKRILVPIDFSKEAESAAKVAARIAKRTGSEVHLLHLLDIPSNPADASKNSSGVSAEQEPQIILYMKAAAKRFETFKKLPFFEGVKVTDAVIVESILPGILNESEDNIDLIVMGSQGVTGLKGIFIGSNTEKVVRNTDVPVLVIKKEKEVFNFDNIVFTSNFKKGSKKTLKKVIEFANLFDAKIHLLYINTPRKFKSTSSIEKKMNKAIDKFDFKNYTTNIYNDKSIGKGLVSFCDNNNIGLIALNTKTNSGISKIFNGGTGQELAKNVPTPVITFNVSE